MHRDPGYMYNYSENEQKLDLVYKLSYSSLRSRHSVQ